MRTKSKWIVALLIAAGAALGNASVRAADAGQGGSLEGASDGQPANETGAMETASHGTRVRVSLPLTPPPPA